MAVRISNTILAILNFCTLVIGGYFLKEALYHPSNNGSGSYCQQLFYLPFLTIGIFLVVLSLFGSIGSCTRETCFLVVYMFILFLMILGLVVFTLYVFIITNRSVGQAITGTGFKEYRLEDYSNWLQKYVVNGDNWPKFKGCFVETEACSSFKGDDNRELSALEFYKMDLNPVQSGCCKPPIHCGFDYQNATIWFPKKSGPTVPDKDCTTWSNDQSKLCYDCKSCMGGVLNAFQGKWRHISIINACIAAFLILVYSIASCAYSNNRADNMYRYRPYPYA